ncbi:MAG: hypothetical protein WA182_11995 [Candidatus Sulfotelmatobacter sp.]
MLNFLDRSIGGSSASPAKAKAAKANGKLGGRPVGTKKRTLGEFLMRQKLKESDYDWVHAGIYHLSREGVRGERYQFERFFGVKVGGGVPISGFPHWTKRLDYNAKHAKKGTAIDRIIRKFRRDARAAR